MQLGGIGSHQTSDAHHVTNCIHSHAHYQEIGNMGAAASSRGAGQSSAAPEVQTDAQFSLSAWLQNTLKNGKRLWGSIWGGSDIGIPGQTPGNSASEQVMAAINDTGVSGDAASDRAAQANRQSYDPSHIAQNLHTPQIAAAATTIMQPQDLQNNPYFSAVEKLDEQEGNLWQRVKVKFKNVAGQLAGHLPGNFFKAQTKSSFQRGKQPPREDLRKRSKFRRDELEIDCMLTDDSYLLDSYDRKGEYSKLSADK